MSNKLKTLSASTLEDLFAKRVSEYIDEECSCSVSELDTPNIDTEADIAETDQRDIIFHVKLTYKESD